MKKVFFLMFIFLLVHASAFAHSTAGRIKTDLKKTNPAIDDFAYFSEPYVTHHLFFEQTKDSKKKMRFFLKEFKNIRIENRKAFIEIVVLDIKNHSTFPHTLEFERDKSGFWHFNSSDNEKIKVFTYVTKGSYYYNKYILPVSFIGLLFFAGFFIFIKFKRKKLEN
jgi:hypothetical protein